MCVLCVGDRSCISYCDAFDTVWSSLASNSFIVFAQAYIL